jgi:hypothetical protein
VKIKRGTTSKRRLIFIADSSSTTGAGLANLVFNSAGLVAYYYASDLANEVQITLVTATLGTYTSGGLVAVDNTNMPGWYEFGIPDAALDGGTEAVIQLSGAANMVPVNIYIELDSVDYQSATNFGLSKFSDIETDTQDIQSRLPSALISGRMNATVGEFQAGLVPANFAALGIQVGGQITSVGTVDELGPSALSANVLDESIAILVWEQLTTATWPTDSFGKKVLIGNSTQRTVAVTGSNHVAADIHELQPGVITGPDFDSTALVAIADSVLGRNTSTSTYDAGDVGYVLRQVYSMIVADGVDWQYTANALELAPAGGGGGGGTDWTANERTAIRGILGFNSSGSVVDPTVGILDEIRDDVGSIGINVYPVSASTPERVSGTTLTFYRNESRSVSVVTDFTLTSMVLEFVVEDAEGNDVLDIANGSISRSGQTFTVSITTAVTATVSNYRWSLRDITSGNSVIARGILSVQDAPSNG